MAVSARTTERRRVRARVAGVVQGVGFRPYVFRLAEELGLGGWVLNDERGVEVEVEGKPAGRRVPGKAPGRGAAARERRIGPRRGRAGERGARRSGSSSRARRRTRGAGLGRLRHLPRLPDRAVRPGRQAPPLSVHQLHELRAAVHDRARRPVRPSADDDGRLRDVRALPGRVRGSRATAASTPSRTRAPSAGPAFASSPGRSRAAAGDVIAIQSRPPRRCSPPARWSRSKGSAATTSPAGPTTRPRSRAARAQAPRGQAVRAHVRRPRRGPGAGRADRARGGAARRPERPIVIARRPSDGPVASGVAPCSPDLGVMLPTRRFITCSSPTWRRRW